MEKKYELVDVDHVYPNVRALRDFGDVKAGELGGRVDDEESLSHDGNCWVYPGGLVRGHSKVEGNAKVYGTVQHGANVRDDAKICRNASADSGVTVGGTAVLEDYEWVTGSAYVESNDDFICALGYGYTAYRTREQGICAANEFTGEGPLELGGCDDIESEFLEIAKAFFESDDIGERGWLKKKARTFNTRFRINPKIGQQVRRKGVLPFDPKGYKNMKVGQACTGLRAIIFSIVDRLAEEKLELAAAYMESLLEYEE